MKPKGQVLMSNRISNEMRLLPGVCSGFKNLLTIFPRDLSLRGFLFSV